MKKYCYLCTVNHCNAMPKNAEIERKFLVLNEDYKQLAYDHYKIWQGYLCKQPGRTIRLRISPKGAFLTIKAPKANTAFSRFEWEHEISSEDAQALTPLCLPDPIEKTRWLVPAAEEGLTWEVDEFHGLRNGLTLAEIELQCESQPFTKASFIGEEVTGDPRYYNANM